MSAPLKFRAWDVDNKLMYTPGTLLDIAAGTFTQRDLEALNFMQYTGLKDKHGREIYQGDIIKGDHSEVPTAEVVWDCLGFALRDGRGRYGDLVTSPQYLNGKSCDWLEVIGNVYESPELLK